MEEEQRLSFFCGAAVASKELRLDDDAEKYYEDAAFGVNMLDKPFKVGLYAGSTPAANPSYDLALVQLGYQPAWAGPIQPVDEWDLYLVAAAPNLPVCRRDGWGMITASCMAAEPPTPT